MTTTPASPSPTPRTRLAQLGQLAALALTCSLPACHPPTRDHGLDLEVVADVGGHPITLQDVSTEIHRRPPSAFGPDAHSPEARRRAALDALIDEEALYQRALAQGLDRDPDVVRRVRSLLIHELRERNLPSPPTQTPSDHDLQLWYDQHPDEFLEPAQARASLISLHPPRRATPEQRQAARQRLEQVRHSILAAPNPTQAFAHQARELSDDPPTRRQGGDTGWLTQGRLTRWPEAVTAFLFQSHHHPNPLHLLETPEALYLIQITDRRPARRRPFDEVKPALSHRVAQAQIERRQRELLDQARAAVVIRQNRQALDRIEVPPFTPGPTQSAPALPGTHASLSPTTAARPDALSQP